MNVQELKAALDDYGDDLPVVIDVFDVEHAEFDVTSGDDAEGNVAVVIVVES
jgi:hypothetical protein